MAELLLPVLCHEWTWNPDESCTVEFNENGIGKIYCSVEFSVFIAAEFDWKTRSNLNIETSFPATIDIDMTLTKRNMNDPNLTKEDVLEDTAFQPKTYSLRLETGSFPVTKRTTYGYNPIYMYRLLWNKSPYPPLEEWNGRSQGAAKACKFWERKDFYHSRIEAENAG